MGASHREIVVGIEGIMTAMQTRDSAAYSSGNLHTLTCYLWVLAAKARPVLALPKAGTVSKSLLARFSTRKSSKARTLPDSSLLWVSTALIESGGSSWFRRT